MAETNTQPKIIFMLALACEAKPIIDFYGLKKIASSPFAHYQIANENHNIDLFVSGIGATAMATAIGWAGAHITKAQKAVWLNVGTAGHATRELGQAVLINSCAGDTIARTHYPPLVCKWSGATESLISVNTPSNQYPSQAAVDMEAQAFFNSAQRFASAELVQSLKVISDNNEHGIEQLNAQKLSDVIYQNIDDITGYAERLLELLRVSPHVDSDLISAPSDLHFTVSQQHQWQDLRRKAVVMLEKSSIDISNLASAKSAKQAITILNNVLLSATPRLDD